MYAAEINERERQLGYSLDRVPNGAGFYQGKEEYVYAVVYYIDNDNIIIKERCPLGGYRYCHRTKERSSWKIINNAEADPQTAILNAREHLAASRRQ